MGVPICGRSKCRSRAAVRTDFFPNHDVFAVKVLRLGSLGLEAEGPDLAGRGQANHLDVEGREFWSADLVRDALHRGRGGAAAGRGGGEGPDRDSSDVEE